MNQRPLTVSMQICLFIWQIIAVSSGIKSWIIWHLLKHLCIINTYKFWFLNNSYGSYVNSTNFMKTAAWKYRPLTIGPILFLISQNCVVNINRLKTLFYNLNTTLAFNMQLLFFKILTLAYILSTKGISTPAIKTCTLNVLLRLFRGGEASLSLFPLVLIIKYGFSQKSLYARISWNKYITSYGKFGRTNFEINSRVNQLENLIYFTGKLTTDRGPLQH